MDQQMIWIIAAVALVVIVVVAVVLLRRRRQRTNRKARLRERYGPEYDRAVADSGSERHAVEELGEREQRHEGLHLRTLGEPERDHVRILMAELQYRFVEDPADTLLEAQRIVTEVLRAQGYPVVTDRAEGLRMLSVDHPMQTQPVRALLQGEYGDDAGDQRHLFLDVRTALRDIADISYSLGDATRTPELPALGLGQPALGQPVADLPAQEEPVREEVAVEQRSTDELVEGHAGAVGPSGDGQSPPHAETGGATRAGDAAPEGAATPQDSPPAPQRRDPSAT